MRRPLFAANWKMHLGPDGARAFVATWRAALGQPPDDRDIWFFPPALSLEAVRRALGGLPHCAVGVQNVHWEPQGAFTGELSVPIAAEAGARAALVGHSERRHVFGETDEMCGRKVRAVLDGGLTPVLCVGERLAEREDHRTIEVVSRQLGVLDGLPADRLARVIVAYEPVWAIGTGRTATPADAAEVHAAIRNRLHGIGVDAATTRILYGGSVKPGNAGDLLAEPDIDGVLVGGASLDPEQWLAVVRAAD